MSSEFWGMTAFFIATLVLLAVSAFLVRKRNQLQQLLDQQKGKANPNQSRDYERQSKK